MTALDTFLYGMPFVLTGGAWVTLWFAKRAAAEIRSHGEAKPSRFALGKDTKDTNIVAERAKRHPQADKVDEAA